MRTLILSALVLSTVPLASAQRGARAVSNTEGLFLQLAVDGQALNYNEDDLDQNDNGGGLSARVGYGFSPLFTLYGGVSGARVDGDTNGVISEEYSFVAAEIGARFNFNRGRALRPYLDVALRGVRASEDDLDLEFTGGGVAVGGGLAYFVSPSVAIDGALRIGAGRFDEVELGDFGLDLDDAGYGEGRLSLGLTFYPLR